MKYILIFLLATSVCFAQTRSFTSSGKKRVLAPATTMSNTTTEVNILSDTIKGKTLSTYKGIKFRVYCSLASALLPPSLTIKIRYGSNSVTLMSGLSLNINQSGQPFTIEGILVNRGNSSSQYIYGKVTQQATLGPLNLTSPIYDGKGIISTNSSVDQLFSVTAQFGAASATTALTIDYWELESDL